MVSSFRARQPTLDAFGFPNFPSAATAAPAPSYDNPISSYDAPIYNDNSYHASSATPVVTVPEEEAPQEAGVVQVVDIEKPQVGGHTL